MVIDPTLGRAARKVNPKDHKKEHKFKKWYVRFSESVNRIFWTIFILLISTQVFLLIASFTANRPNERMCWEKTMCYSYCEKGSHQARCIAPERSDTEDFDKAWQLLLMGKRNIVEVLDPQQRYCACVTNYSDQPPITETFYHYYWDQQ